MRGHPARLTSFNVADVVVALVGYGVDPLDREILPGSHRRVRQQADVRHVVVNLLLGNQVVLRIHRDLDVVAHHGPLWVFTSRASGSVRDNCPRPLSLRCSRCALIDVARATSEGVSPPAQCGGTSSQSSAVSWDSGLRQAGDSEVGPGAGDAHIFDLFRPASEPVDGGTGEVQGVSAAGEDGGGGPGAASDPRSGTDANPAGTVSEPTESLTSTSGVGTGTEQGSSGTFPGTPDPVPARTQAFEVPGPSLGLDPGGDAAAGPNRMFTT